MRERIYAQRKNAATPSMATQSSSPLFQQRRFSDEQTQPVASNSTKSNDWATLQRKIAHSLLNRPNISPYPAAKSAALTALGGIQLKCSECETDEYEKNINIHQAAQAKSIKALAYTHGNHIHFKAPGKYNPTSEEGQKRSHELTHVVQQRSGRMPLPQKGTPINADPALEAEADQLGAKAAKGEPVTVAGASSSWQRKSALTAPIQLWPKLKMPEFVKTAVNKVTSGVKTAANNVASGVSTVTSKVTSGLSTVKNKVSSGVKTFTNKVKRGVSNVKNKVKSGVKSFTNKIKRGVKTVKNQVKRAYNTTKRGFNVVKNRVKRSYNTVKNRVKRSYNLAKNQIKRGYSSVKNLANRGFNVAKRGFNIVKNKVKSQFNAAKNKVKSHFNSVKNKVKSGFNTAKNKVKSGFNTVKNGVKNVNWRDVGHAALDVAGFIPVVGAVADVANAAWYLAEGDYANAALSAVSAIPGVGDAIGGVAKGGKAALKLAKGSNMLGKASKFLPNAGKLVGIGGLANKVSSSAGKLVGKVGGLANKIPPGVKSAFNKGMSGFNKVMNVADKVGTGVDVASTAQYLAQGDYGNALASGISAIPGVGKGRKGIFNRAKGNKLFNQAGKGVGKVGGLANKLPGGIKSLLGKGKDGLSAAKNKFNRGVSGLGNKLGRGKGKPNTGKDVPHKVSGTKTPGGAKPKRDLPMTTKEQNVLNNTASKRGNELTPKELNAEREVARRAERKPSNDGEHVEQIDLPNGHELKKRKDGTWCRFSDEGKCGPEFDPDLANRGYRPKPGERSMTREQWKEQRRQERIRRRMQRLEAEGHGPARHGSQITEQQLVDRATLGHDPVTGTTDDAYNKFPDGTPKPHKYGRHATKVTTDEAYVKAEARIKNSQQFKDETAAADAEGRTRTEAIEMSLEDIYGSDYKKKVYGKTRLGSANNPTGTTDTEFTDGKMRTYYEKDASGNWRLITMYPNPQ